MGRPSLRMKYTKMTVPAKANLPPRLAVAATKYLNKFNALDSTVRWQTWPAELNSFYTGVGQRRSNRQRYMFARALVLCLGLDPRQAVTHACEFINSEGRLRYHYGAKTLRWKQDTSNQMMSREWWLKQHSYYDVLDGTYVRKLPQ